MEVIINWLHRALFHQVILLPRFVHFLHPTFGFVFLALDSRQNTRYQFVSQNRAAVSFTLLLFLHEKASTKALVLSNTTNSHLVQ